MATNLNPNKKASTRTKNRLREHGPFLVMRTETVQAFKEECHLLQCVRCTWRGWIPLSEIEKEIANAN